jgi:hypothetical protein
LNNLVPGYGFVFQKTNCSIMKRSFPVFIMLLLISSYGFAQSKAEKQVTAAVQQLRQAMLDANKEQLEAITADNLSYGHSSGKIEGKSSFVESLVTGVSDFITMDLTAEKITVSGNTALVRHNLTGNVKDSGVPNTVRLGVLLVWQKQHRKWRLLARQAYKL